LLDSSLSLGDSSVLTEVLNSLDPEWHPGSASAVDAAIQEIQTQQPEGLEGRKAALLGSFDSSSQLRRRRSLPSRRS
jgi:hypothetical protein